MIGYRFLSPVEDEMAESALFYENAAAGSGSEFLDAVQHVIDLLRRQPKLGSPLAGNSQ